MKDNFDNMKIRDGDLWHWSGKGGKYSQALDLEKPFVA
jgi:hypothetical protein